MWSILWPPRFARSGDWPVAIARNAATGLALVTPLKAGVQWRVVVDAVPVRRDGTMQPLFGADLFDRVHVTPAALNLGNLSSVQRRDVRVWNASGTQAVRVAAVDVRNGDGVVLTAPGPTPLPLPPRAERTWNVAVQPDGPPVIAAELSFVFEGRAAITVPITGHRIIAWTFAPDWANGVIERLEWRTDVLQSPTGAEQRRALRLSPRRSFEADGLVEGRERTLLDLTVAGWGARVFALPIWPDVEWLRAAHGLGVRRIACATAGRDFRAGGLALLRGPSAFDAEVIEVEAIEAAALVLKHPTQQAWPPGTRLYPVRAARLSEAPRLQRLTDRLARVTVRFDVVEACDWPEIGAPVMYRGAPVLDTAPDESEALDTTWQSLLQSLDNTTGHVLVLDPGDRAYGVHVHRWRTVGRTERAGVRSWLYALRGRQRPTWRPTHAQDLVLLDRMAANATTLDIAAVGYSRFAAQRSGRRDVRIALWDGTAWHRRITGAVALDEGAERLTLDAALGRDVRPDQVARISFMALCRGDEDAVEIHHHADSDGVADVAITLRDLRDET